MPFPSFRAFRSDKGGFRDRAWLGAALVLLATTFIRFRSLHAPLERDEGEFAYMGQLILQGVPPYAQAYNMKFPGMYYLYAGAMRLFGQTPAGIHLGLWLANAVGTILVYRLARRFLDGPASAAACAVFGFMSLSPTMLGTSAHATQFVVPFVLGGFLLLLDAGRRPWTLALSGALFALAVIVKQHAILFAVFAFLAVLLGWGRKPAGGAAARVRELAALGAGMALPVGAMFLALARAGLFPKFWFWTITYGRQYVSILTPREAFATFLHATPPVLEGWGWVLLLAAGGAYALLRDPDLRSARAVLLAFALFSFLSVCPGFYFRHHYFITLVPALALLAGCAAQALGAELERRWAFAHGGLVLFGTALILPMYTFGFLFFQADDQILSRSLYPLSCFPEMKVIGERLKAHMGSGDQLAVLGSEPEIYFYAGHRAATGYLYVYPLMEKQPLARRMQEEMCGQLEAANPRFVVMVQNNNSWLGGPGSDLAIFARLETWMSGRYRVVGTVESAPATLGYEEHWGAEAAAHRFRHPLRMTVFERVS